jgi:RHS repeat-associated protein
MDTSPNAHHAGRGRPGAGLARPLRAALLALVLALHCSAASAVAMCAAAVGVGLHGGGLLSSLVGGLLGAAAGVRDALAGLAGAGPRAVDCMPAEQASVPAPGLSQVAGNPVDLLTGAKLDRAVDAHFPLPESRPAPRPGPPLELLFSRMYSSIGAGSDALGPGWRHGFETRLHAGLDGQGRAQLQVLQADGRLVRFGAGRRASAGLLRHEALHRDDGVLDRLPRKAAEEPAAVWAWRWRDGRVLGFAADGRLLSVADGGTARLSLEYEPAAGRLVAVRDAAGNALRLVYGDQGEAMMSGTDSTVGQPSRPHARSAQRLAALLLPGGARVRYGYDDRGRLESVRHPGGEAVRYRYDASGAARLAGVTLPDGRSSEYRYDTQGRVAWSRAAGAADLQALQFDYVGGEDGSGLQETRVSRESRLLASYRWRTLEDGETRAVVAAEGSGCGECPPTGVAYRYRQGRLSGLEAGNRRWELVHDPRGRLVAVTGPDARSGGASVAVLSVQWDADDVVDRPLRVSRPSVAPGRAHVLRFDYSPAGALRSVRESGFAPVVHAGPDGGGRVAGVVPIGRVLSVGGAGGAGGAGVERGGPMQVPAGAAHEGGGRWTLRAPNGAVTRWWLDDFGRAVATASADAGLTRWVRDEAGRLVREHAADGTVAHLARDAHGRLVEHALRRGGHPPVLTRFRHRDGRIVGVAHPGQDEAHAYDGQGRLVQRTVRLRLASGRIAEYRTRYRYEGARRRPGAWSLPDGSWVVQRYDRHGREQALERLTADGAHRMQLVGEAKWAPSGLVGADYGNGARMRIDTGPGGRPARLCHGSGRTGAAPCDLVDHRLFFDASGSLVEWVREDVRAFHLHDSSGRLLQALERGRGAEVAWRYAYDGNGNRLPVGVFAGAAMAGASSNRRLVRDAVRHAEAGPATAPRWDHAGRLVDDGLRRYRWTPMGLLAEVSGPAGTLAEYRYDHRGQRIAARSDGRWRYFLFDERRRPIAELDDEGRLTRQYLHFADRPVAVIDQAGGSERTVFLHLDHRGAPVLASDAVGVPVWRARHAPFGRLVGLQAQAGFALALRLPGQHEDEATGLHYNDHRWYDPDTGRYLSPDPLGLRGGPNPYAYAGNDPLTRVDPTGLLLFAFDGTNNSDPPPGQDDWSNVYKLSRSYADGRVWYMAGVGRPDAGSGIGSGIGGGNADLVAAQSARARVDYMLSELIREASLPRSAARWLNVDVIGFSRGASMARDFANRVADRIASGAWSELGTCVRLRFLGLWDTVAQFGSGGTQDLAWRLSVPADVAYAAHAVALNEHRTLFPVESIEGAPAGGARIERGFIGAHSDIGGSYAEGDLSDVALGWMHAQARNAGVRMLALTSEFARVTSPLLHDSNTDGRGDREFRLRNSMGLITTSHVQRAAPVAGMQWEGTGGFIQRYEKPRQDVYGAPTLVGTVGMEEYAQWLRGNYGLRIDWSP